MSHTWKNGETTFIGNADLSGDITISKTVGSQTFHFTIPAKDLMNFAHNRFLDEKISKLESDYR